MSPLTLIRAFVRKELLCRVENDTGQASIDEAQTALEACDQIEKAMRNCATDLEGELDERYPMRDRYPMRWRRHQRDMETVRVARAAVKEGI